MKRFAAHTRVLACTFTCLLLLVSVIPPLSAGTGHLSSGDFAFDHLHTFEAARIPPDSPRNILLDFRVNCYVHHENLSRIEFTFYEPVFMDGSVSPHDVQLVPVHSFHITQEQIVEAADWGGWEHDIPEIDGLFSPTRHVFNRFGVEGWIITGSFRLAHGSALSAPEDGDDEHMYTPLSILFVTEGGHSDGEFAHHDLWVPWYRSFSGQGAFMEQANEVANMLVLVAGSVGALMLIIMAYKYMNPAMDPEEKKELRGDAGRWVVGLCIIFSARIISELVQWIATG